MPCPGEQYVFVSSHRSLLLWEYIIWEWIWNWAFLCCGLDQKQKRQERHKYCDVVRWKGDCREAVRTPFQESGYAANFLALPKSRWTQVLCRMDLFVEEGKSVVVQCSGFKEYVVAELSSFIAAQFCPIHVEAYTSVVCWLLFSSCRNQADGATHNRAFVA